MSDDVYLPELPAAWEGTRATLHAYALAVAAIPRAYAEAHPKWWHVSLKLTDGGFVTGGGWIDSRPGAYRPEPELYGKATFGFVSKYKKGATTPTGIRSDSKSIIRDMV